MGSGSVAKGGDAVDVAKLEAWHVDVNRLVADGIAYPDIQQAARQLTTWDQWYDQLAAQGDEYAEKGRRELERGHRALAGEFLWRACMAFHYAQFMWFHDLPRREEGQRRKQELYAEAAPLLVPPAERLQVDVDGVVVNAYLRRPLGAAAEVPCAVLLGGLESTKEESYLFENECLRRGVATCAFDGPGQGETFFARTLSPGFEDFTSRVIDALAERADIDSERIGVVGRSLGGNYAIRSAAFDKRIKACVAWGAPVTHSNWNDRDGIIKLAYAYISGFKPDQLDETGEYVRATLDLTAVAPRVQCPVYVQHGELDPGIPLDQAQLLVDALTSAARVDFDVIPGGGHCSHNRYQIARPLVVDWIVAALGGLT